MIAENAHVTFRDLQVRRGGNQALKRVSGSITKHCILGLWGPNGSGKTTLLQVVARWRRPDSGEIEWSSDRRRQPVLMPAHAAEMLFPWYRVRKNLDIYAGLAVDRGHDAKVIGALREQFVGILNLGPHLEKYPLDLSSGQQARVALACAIVYRPSVLMIDEAFTHIDWQGQEAIAASLTTLFEGDDDLSIVLVSHAPTPLFVMSQQIWSFQDGGFRAEAHQPFFEHIAEVWRDGTARPV